MNAPLYYLHQPHTDYKQFKSTPSVLCESQTNSNATLQRSTFKKNKYIFFANFVYAIYIATRFNRASPTYYGKFPLYMIGYVSAKMFIMAKIGTAHIHIGSDVSGKIFLGILLESTEPVNINCEYNTYASTDVYF